MKKTRRIIRTAAFLLTIAILKTMFLTHSVIESHKVKDLWDVAWWAAIGFCFLSAGVAAIAGVMMVEKKIERKGTDYLSSLAGGTLKNKPVSQGVE